MSVRMKQNWIMILLSTLLVVLLLPTPERVKASGTISNASFDDDAASQTPSGWLESGDVNASYSQSGGRTGNKLSHWSVNSYEVTTYQTVTGLTNGVYTLSAWVASSGEQVDNALQVSGYGGPDLSADVPVSLSWIQIRIEGIEVTNGQLKIAFYSKANATNWSNLDDLVLERLPSVAIGNSGFDGNTGGAPINWLQSGDTAASYVEPGGVAGGNRLAHWSASSYEVTTYQTVTGLTNGTYTLSAWAKSSGEQESAYLEASDYGSQSLKTSFPARNEWTRIYIRGIEVTNGQLRIAIHSKANPGNWINLDSLALVGEQSQYSFIKGVDPSYLQEAEPNGVLFRDRNGIVKDAIDIYEEEGVNFVRIRIWHNPDDYSLEQALELAERAHDAGMGIIVNLHYSPTWASNHQQTKPDEWATLGFADLKQALYDYTQEVVEAFIDQGTPPDIVQIGNETDKGMLWPTGKVNRDGANNWDEYADLLKSGFQAVKDISLDIRTMIHSEDGSSITRIREHIDPLWQRGVQPDILGFSYYTSWNENDLDGLSYALTDAIYRYDLPVLVQETAYPFYPHVPGVSNYIYQSVQELYDQTLDGQKRYMLDIMNRIKALPEGKGLGVVYWGADGIEPSGQWNNGALFDYGNNNVGNPALGAFLHN